MKNMLNMSPMTDQAFSHPYSKVLDNLLARLDNSLARIEIDTPHEHFDFMFEIKNGGRIVLVNIVFGVCPQEEVWRIEIGRAM